MSVQYGAIGWNRQKKIYDAVLISLLVLYLAIFVGFGTWWNPNATAETLLIRAFGTAAFLLLNALRDCLPSRKSSVSIPVSAATRCLLQSRRSTPVLLECCYLLRLPRTFSSLRVAEGSACSKSAVLAPVGSAA